MIMITAISRDIILFPINQINYKQSASHANEKDLGDGYPLCVQIYRYNL